MCSCAIKTNASSLAQPGVNNLIDQYMDEPLTSTALRTLQERCGALVFAYRYSKRPRLLCMRMNLSYFRSWLATMRSRMASQGRACSRCISKGKGRGQSHEQSMSASEGAHQPPRGLWGYRLGRGALTKRATKLLGTNSAPLASMSKRGLRTCRTTKALIHSRGSPRRL